VGAAAGSDPPQLGDMGAVASSDDCGGVGAAADFVPRQLRLWWARNEEEVCPNPADTTAVGLIGPGGRLDWAR
jgi:hypothetical protein